MATRYQKSSIARYTVLFSCDEPWPGHQVPTTFQEWVSGPPNNEAIAFSRAKVIAAERICQLLNLSFTDVIACLEKSKLDTVIDGYVHV